MGQTTCNTIEHVVVATNQPYDQVVATRPHVPLSDTYRCEGKRVAIEW